MKDRVAELEATLRRCQEAHRQRDMKLGGDFWRQEYELACDAFAHLLKKVDGLDAKVAAMVAANERRKEASRAEFENRRPYRAMELEIERLRRERDDAREAAKSADARYFALQRRIREGRAA